MSDHPIDDMPDPEDGPPPSSQAWGERLKAMLQETSGKVILAIAGVAIILLFIGVARACGGAGDSAASISEAASELADDLDDISLNTNVGNLDDEADNVHDAARRLARNATPEFDNLDDLESTFEDVRSVRQAILSYIDRAADLAEISSNEEDAEEASKALERAAEFIESDSVSAAVVDLTRTSIDVYFEENARRYDDRDAERYLEAVETTTQLQIDEDIATVEYNKARAAIAVANYGSNSDQDKAYDRLEQARDARNEADEELERAWDDRVYFSDLIEWRE